MENGNHASGFEEQFAFLIVLLLKEANRFVSLHRKQRHKYFLESQILREENEKGSRFIPDVHQLMIFYFVGKN